MNKINWKYVLLGGLLGGLLWFGLAFLRAIVVDPDGALLEIGLPFDRDTALLWSPLFFASAWRLFATRRQRPDPHQWRPALPNCRPHRPRLSRPSSFRTI